MKIMRILGSVLAALLLFGHTVAAEEILRSATTTSTENSGLLAGLLPPFEKAHDAKVAVIAIGTGKAIKLGESVDFDVILVHARGRDKKNGQPLFFTYNK